MLRARPIQRGLQAFLSANLRQGLGARGLAPVGLPDGGSPSASSSAPLESETSSLRWYRASRNGPEWHATTVLSVRKADKVVIIADGQVTMGSEVVKHNVKKVRRLGDNVIGGFAGATADALTLFERLETKLEEHPGQLTRAAVELAKAWRTDKFLRKLDAIMVVADAEISLLISGNGDVIEPADGIIGIGSGGTIASSAARALVDLPYMDAESIAKKAMKIAAETCIYTNDKFTMEEVAINIPIRPSETTLP